MQWCVLGCDLHSRRHNPQWDGVAACRFSRKRISTKTEVEEMCFSSLVPGGGMTGRSKMIANKAYLCKSVRGGMASSKLWQSTISLQLKYVWPDVSFLPRHARQCLFPGLRKKQFGKRFSGSQKAEERQLPLPCRFWLAQGDVLGARNHASDSSTSSAFSHILHNQSPAGTFLKGGSKQAQ
jgi:hypothetical protein